MEKEKPNLIFECCVCNKEVDLSKEGKVYVLGSFDMEKEEAVHFCSLECFDKLCGEEAE